jgi:hypothetical protein
LTIAKFRDKILNSGSIEPKLLERTFISQAFRLGTGPFLGEEVYIMKNSIRFIIALAFALIASQVLAQSRNPDYTGVSERLILVGTRVDGAVPRAPVLVPMAPVTGRSVFGLVSEDVSLTYGLQVGNGRANVVYLVRAIGPGLETLGVSGGIARPTITIHRNGEEMTKAGFWANLEPVTRTVVSDMRRAEEMAGTFPLDIHNRDSAVIVSLPEGTYTIGVSPAEVEGGSKSAGGKVLLQIFELPALAVANREPTIPQLMNSYAEGSLSVRVNRELSIGVSSSDADGDDIDFIIDWDDDGIADQTVRGRTAMTTHIAKAWPSTGERFIRVSAKDARSAYAGGYGSYGSFGSYGIGIRIKIRVTSIEE